jgi:hypothetical protein
MAKAKAKGNGKVSGGEESVSGYFRTIFEENPKLLKTRSNDELLRRWLADHPGTKEVPNRVKQGLANVKSVLRKRGRRRGRRPGVAPGQAVAAVPTSSMRPSPGLEQLEEQIDDCLTAAKELGGEGIEDVLRLLRQARNEVDWKLGQ